jgi:hypothetical protein
VPLTGKLFEMLGRIYAKSDKECDIDISFNKDADGKQQNPCRTLIIDYLRKPALPAARQIAVRLSQFTTNRSRLGLLFLIVGKEADERKILVSRFPADSGILAEENQAALSVEFLERVFMKSATTYKAAVYQHASLEGGFWIGRAVDKQINSNESHLSLYWIREFLDSDFRTTSAAGTRRLAVALRDASRRSDDVSVRSEIAAAVTLANGLAGKLISVTEFGNQFGLSAAAKSAVAKQMRNPTLRDEKFQFDLNEFSSQVGYRSVELDSGGMLTAESADFDDVFQREAIDPARQLVRFSTEGRIVGERLRKSKPA